MFVSGQDPSISSFKVNYDDYYFNFFNLKIIIIITVTVSPSFSANGCNSNTVQRVYRDIEQWKKMWFYKCAITF